MQDRLCAELYDYIIDFLHDDRGALQACSLVCWAWLPASRSHLFYHLSDLTLRATRVIFRVIDSSPHIASYVKKISVHHSWAIEQDIFFPSLLNKFIYLRELEFNFFISGSLKPKTSRSTTAFEDLCDVMSSMALQSFTLRRFTFSSPHDFLKIVHASRRAQALQLDEVNISITHLSVSALEDLFNSTHDGPQGEIKRLSLRSASLPIIIPILLHPRSPLNFSTTTFLTTHMTMNNYDNMIQFLACFPNLESLDLEIESSFDYEAHLGHGDIVDLKLLSSLKSLSLQVSALLARTDPIPWLLPCLASAAPDNTLEDLSLTCVIDKPPPFLTIQAFDNILMGWGSLDELLTRPPFGRLQRFRLDFALDNPIDDDSPRQIADEFTKQLRDLSRKGILEVDVYEIR